MEAVGIKVGFPAYICRVADSGLLGLVYNIDKIFQIAFQTFIIRISNDDVYIRSGCDNFLNIFFAFFFIYKVSGSIVLRMRIRIRLIIDSTVEEKKYPTNPLGSNMWIRLRLLKFNRPLKNCGSGVIFFIYFFLI